MNGLRFGMLAAGLVEQVLQTADGMLTILERKGRLRDESVGEVEVDHGNGVGLVGIAPATELACRKRTAAGIGILQRRFHEGPQDGQTGVLQRGWIFVPCVGLKFQRQTLLPSLPLGVGWIEAQSRVSAIVGCCLSKDIDPDVEGFFEADGWISVVDQLSCVPHHEAQGAGSEVGVCRKARPEHQAVPVLRAITRMIGNS